MIILRRGVCGVGRTPECGGGCPAEEGRMSGFIVFKNLTIQETFEGMLQAEKFLREHPSRKLVRTDLFPIRRGYVVEDVLKHSKWKLQ